jgi:hypothetical protein
MRSEGAGSRRRVFLWAIPGESVAGTIAEMSALFFGPPAAQATRLRSVAMPPPAHERTAGPCLPHGRRFKARPQNHARIWISQKLFLIAWAALGAIATIGWLYFIAISFGFIINLL